MGNGYFVGVLSDSRWSLWMRHGDLVEEGEEDRRRATPSSADTRALVVQSAVPAALGGRDARPGRFPVPSYARSQSSSRPLEALPGVFRVATLDFQKRGRYSRWRLCRGSSGRLGEHAAWSRKLAGASTRTLPVAAGRMSSFRVDGIILTSRKGRRWATGGGLVTQGLCHA